MFKHIFFIILITFLSIFLGIYFNDRLFGTIAFSSGILHIWYLIHNKRFNYIFGIIFYLFNFYIYYKHNLYCTFFIYLFTCIPLQIDGFLFWKNKKLFESIKNNVSIIKYFALITISIGLSLLLNNIENQYLSLLDSFNCISTLFSIILINLHYKNGFFMLFINSNINLLIWIIYYIRKSPNSIMMLFLYISYFTLSIYAIIKYRKS